MTSIQKSLSGPKTHNAHSHLREMFLLTCGLMHSLLNNPDRRQINKSQEKQRFVDGRSFVLA